MKSSLLKVDVVKNHSGHEHLPGWCHSLLHLTASRPHWFVTEVSPSLPAAATPCGLTAVLPVLLSQQCFHTPASGRLGRSRSGCRGLGPGKIHRMAGKDVGWGWQGRGMWLGSSVVKGGRLSEQITIKHGPGPSSLMCSSLERKLHFQSALLRKEDVGEQKVVLWSLCSRSLSVVFTALGQI